MRNTKFTIFFLLLLAPALLGLLSLDLYRMHTKNREIGQLLSEVGLVANEKAALSAVRAQRTEAAKDIGLFESRALTDETLVPTIESIERAGRVIGLVVEIASVEKGEEEANPVPVRFVVETRGSWSDTLTFVKAMENLPHQVVIGHVSLSKDLSLWRGSLSFSIPSFK